MSRRPPDKPWTPFTHDDPDLPEPEVFELEAQPEEKWATAIFGVIAFAVVGIIAIGAAAILIVIIIKTVLAIWNL
jgi:hypothetical protein